MRPFRDMDEDEQAERVAMLAGYGGCLSLLAGLVILGIMLWLLL